ncbi:MAG: hypothetical protein R3B90_21425 [Planctomycetaceae bacterium]
MISLVGVGAFPGWSKYMTNSFGVCTNAPSILIALAVSVSLVGCYSYEVVDVSNVKTDAIHQAYSVFFDGESGQTMVAAGFRVGGSTGSTLDLTGKSSVECNEQRLGQGTFIGRYYGALDPGTLRRMQVCVHRCGGNSVCKHDSSRAPEFADDAPETLSRSERNTLRFEGPPIGEGELVVLEVIPDALDRADVELFRKDPTKFVDKARERRNHERELARTTSVGATSVVIPPEVLSRIDNGPIKVQWRRSSSHDLENATPAGGVMSAHYQSTPRRSCLKTEDVCSWIDLPPIKRRGSRTTRCTRAGGSVEFAINVKRTRRVNFGVRCKKWNPSQSSPFDLILNSFFEDYDGDHFTVRLVGSELSATLRVWGYTDCQSLVEMLFVFGVSRGGLVVAR